MKTRTQAYQPPKESLLDSDGGGVFVDRGGFQEPRI